MRLVRFFVPVLLAAAGLAAPAAAQYGTKPKPAAAASEETLKAAEKILVDLEERGDVPAARKASEELLRSLASQDKPAAELAAAARVYRIVTIVAEATGAGGEKPAKPGQKGEKPPEKKPADAPDAKKIAGLLRSLPATADALAWNYRPGKDRGAEVVAVLRRLKEAGAPLEERPQLAAAVALVHDQRNPRAQEWTPGPEDVMGYFSGGPRLQSWFGSLPCVLLVHVVDSPASVDELSWANGQFGRSGRLGEAYRRVQYDTSFFKGTQPKKIEGKPYTLENILRYGGVCVEQAYFAEMVGKSSGVPAATVTAKGDSVGHAWIGFVHTKGGGWAWDLTEGRYKEYDGEEADVLDPQTVESITDAELQMKADRASTAQDLVRESLARADAALLIADPAEALAMMERAVNACPYVPTAWERMGALAAGSKLSTQDLEKWAGALVNLCGTKYPDFAIRMLGPMVRAVPEAKDRAACWGWARRQLVDAQRNRSMVRYDLGVTLRVREGDCLKDAGDMGGAWEAYREAISMYGKKTAAAQEAAMRCEKMLQEADRPAAAAVDFWEWAWKQTEKPSGMSTQFAMGSNWSVFGMRYAAALERAGDASKAANIRRQILPKS